MAGKHKHSRVFNKGAQRSRFTPQQMKRAGRIKMQPTKLGYHSNRASDLPPEQFEVTNTDLKESSG